MPNTDPPSKGLLDGAKEKEALRLSKRKEHNLLVRELCDSDLPALLKLCLGNPQYYAYLGEGPTIESLAAEMGELPPGCAPDRKSCLGFFDVEGALVAVLDLVRGYPVERCAFIGFFMVDASRRGWVSAVGSSLGSSSASTARASFAYALPTSRATSSPVAFGRGAGSRSPASPRSKGLSLSCPWSARCRSRHLLGSGYAWEVRGASPGTLGADARCPCPASPASTTHWHSTASPSC